MNSPTITIGLVLYKGEKYLEACLTSLINQNYPHIEFLIRDQSPNGEAYEFIKKELPDLFNRLHIQKGENLLHSGGHNALIRQMNGDYYFCCSADMWYPSDFASRITHELEKPENKKYGSTTCKLMVWNFPLYHPDHPEVDKTNIIDSCGLGIKRNHYYYDIGQGEKDEGQYNKQTNIFGASGALAVYRKQALKEIRFRKKKDSKKVLDTRQKSNFNRSVQQKVREDKNLIDNEVDDDLFESLEYFDELIHYKNDIDLAYRLQWAGWPCLFMPNIKVYHDRKASTPYSSKFRLVRMLKARKTKSRWIKENSFFGQQIVLIKNYSKKFSIYTKIRTTFHQWGILFFTLVFEPYLLKQLRALKKNEKEILAKRDLVKHNVKPKVIEKLMS